MTSASILSREVSKNIRRHFPHHVFEVEIPRAVALAEAPSFSKPIILYRPDSPGAQAYERLAREVIAQEVALAEAVAAPRCQVKILEILIFKRLKYMLGKGLESLIPKNNNQGQGADGAPPVAITAVQRGRQMSSHNSSRSRIRVLFRQHQPPVAAGSSNLSQPSRATVATAAPTAAAKA